MNYTFLHNTKDLVDDNCVFYPRKLEFHWVQRTNYTDVQTIDQIDLNAGTGNDTIQNVTNPSTKNENNTESVNLHDYTDSIDNKTADSNTKAVNNATEDAQKNTPSDDGSDKVRVRRNAQEFMESSNVTTMESRNATFLYGKCLKNVFINNPLKQLLQVFHKQLHDLWQIGQSLLNCSQKSNCPFDNLI